MSILWRHDISTISAYRPITTCSWHAVNFKWDFSMSRARLTIRNITPSFCSTRGFRYYRTSRQRRQLIILSTAPDESRVVCEKRKDRSDGVIKRPRRAPRYAISATSSAVSHRETMIYMAHPHRKPPAVLLCSATTAMRMKTVSSLFDKYVAAPVKRRRRPPTNMLTYIYIYTNDSANKYLIFTVN